MRHTLSLLTFLVCLAAGLDGRAMAAETTPIALDDFSYTDTSAEPTDQSAAHERRLQAFMVALRRDIAADPRYRVAPSVQGGGGVQGHRRHPEDQHAGAMGQGRGD
jgi:hypothetical protein